jgi:hypothetical protein
VDTKGESLDSRAAELLAAHDAQLRARVPDALPAGEVVESEGPLLRFSGGPGGGWVLYRDLGGLVGAALDELIARQVSFFAKRGERFEWKYYGHDLPPDLPERLLAAGFVCEPTEAVVIARVADIAAEPRVPEGVSLREVTARADFERIAAMECMVWRRARLASRHARVRAQGRSRLAHDRGGRGRRHGRLGRLDPLRARDRVRCVIWRGDTRGLAAARNLPRHRRLPSEPGPTTRLPLSRDRRFRRQPPDSRTARVRPGDGHYPVRLVSARLGRRQLRSGGSGELGLAECFPEDAPLV